MCHLSIQRQSTSVKWSKKLNQSSKRSSKPSIQKILTKTTSSKKRSRWKFRTRVFNFSKVSFKICKKVDNLTWMRSWTLRRAEARSWSRNRLKRARTVIKTRMQSQVNRIRVSLAPRRKKAILSPPTRTPKMLQKFEDKGNLKRRERN